MPKKYKYTKYFTYDGHRYVVRANSMEELYERKLTRYVTLKKDVSFYLVVQQLSNGRLKRSMSIRVRLYQKKF